jgi:hypothetical protein
MEQEKSPEERGEKRVRLRSYTVLSYTLRYMNLTD